MYYLLFCRWNLKSTKYFLVFNMSHKNIITLIYKTLENIEITYA